MRLCSNFSVGVAKQYVTSLFFESVSPLMEFKVTALARVLRAVVPSGPVSPAAMLHIPAPHSELANCVLPPKFYS